jgi:ankyrin repeat protein
MGKDIPLISKLLRALIVEDYASAIDVITDDKFNPNEKNTSWGAPVLTVIITVLGNDEKYKDNKNFREILKEIVKHKDFDPNAKDSEGETILMHIARNSTFNWLVPFLLCCKDIDVNAKNFMKKDAVELAEKRGNTTFADIIIGFRAEAATKHMPKKRVGIKKTPKKVNLGAKNISNIKIIDRIEKAFEEDSKKNPVSLYNLLINFFDGNYRNCIQIIKDVNFNPNECDRWDEPALSSLIYYSQDANVEYDEEAFKEIVDAMISIPRFDVNALDADCNTILMVAMGFPKLQWLAEKLFNINSARLDVMNDMGENIRSIANGCGNGDFYNHLVRKSFETVNSID